MSSPDGGRTRRQVLELAGGLLTALGLGGVASATDASSRSAEPLSGRPDIRGGVEPQSGRPDIRAQSGRPDVRDLSAEPLSGRPDIRSGVEPQSGRPDIRFY